jgi:hypothetical protein
VNGSWTTIGNDSDLGQSFILKGNSGSWELRVFDTNGNQYYSRSYLFGFPDSCPGQRCGGDPAYEVSYMNGYAPAYEGKGEAYAAARQMVPTRADTTNVPHIEDEVEVKIFGKEDSQEFVKIDDSQKTDEIKYVPFPVKGFENTPPYQKTDEV